MRNILTLLFCTLFTCIVWFCQVSPGDDAQDDRDHFEVFVSNPIDKPESTLENIQHDDGKLDSYAQFQSDGHITRPITPESVGGSSSAPGKALARLAVMKEMHAEACPEQGTDKKAKTKPIEATRE